MVPRGSVRVEASRGLVSVAEAGTRELREREGVVREAGEVDLLLAAKASVAERTKNDRLL